MTSECFALFISDLPELPENQRININIWLRCYFVAQFFKLKNPPTNYQPLIHPDQAITYITTPHTLAEWFEQRSEKTKSIIEVMHEFPSEQEAISKYFSGPFAFNKKHQTPLPKNMDIKQWLNAQWLRFNLRHIERLVLKKTKEHELIK